MNPRQRLQLIEKYAMSFIKKYRINTSNRLSEYYKVIVSADCKKMLEFDSSVNDIFKSKYWFSLKKYNELNHKQEDAIQIQNTNDSFFVSQINELCKTISRSPYKDLLFSLPINRSAPLCIAKFYDETHLLNAYLVPEHDLIPSTTIDDGMYYLHVEQDITDSDCYQVQRINGLAIPNNIELIDDNQLIGSVHAVINTGINARCLNCGMSCLLHEFTEDYDITNYDWHFNLEYLRNNHNNCRCLCTCYSCIKWREWRHNQELKDRLRKQRSQSLRYIRQQTGKDFGD